MSSASQNIPASDIGVLIVDDHDMVRIGLRTSLNVSEGLFALAEARNGAEAIEVYKEQSPDVVLMDIVMSRVDGISAAKSIIEYDPDACIIALTSFNDEKLIEGALKAGITSYILKDISMLELGKVIRDAFEGKATLAQEATRILIAATRRPEEPGHDLTSTELIVLQNVAEGMSNRQIAEKLVVSPSTIKKHVSSVIAKLDVNNRAEAAALAVHYDLVKIKME